MTDEPAAQPWLALQQWLEDLPEQQRLSLGPWLEAQPPALQLEPSWAVCLQAWIAGQGAALQTLLQHPLADGPHETTLTAGLALLRWLNQQRQQVPEEATRATLGDALAWQLELVTGALHRGLVLECWQGERRPEWLWCGWELLGWREAMATPLVPWWPPLKEQLVRFGALAWAEQARAHSGQGPRGLEATTRTLTLLQALSPLHDPLPLWIPQLQRELVELGLTAQQNQQAAVNPAETTDQAALREEDSNLSQGKKAPYHYRTAVPLRFSFLERRDGQTILQSTHNYGYFSCLSTILWDLIACANHGIRPDLVNSRHGMRHFKDDEDADLFGLHFMPPGPDERSAIPLRKELPIPAHHGDYRLLDHQAIRPFLEAYFRPQPRISSITDKLSDKYCINTDKLLATCYRGTDKAQEVDPAPAADYLRKAQEVLQRDPELRVMVQTDQQQVRDYLLSELGETAFALEELPVTEGTTAIHLCLNENKQEFADHLLAVTLLMAHSRWLITHTGNVAFWSALFRGHSKRLVQFGSLDDP